MKIILKIPEMYTIDPIFKGDYNKYFIIENEIFIFINQKVFC